MDRSHYRQRSYMLKNYFKTTWRLLIQNKTFSLINIFGLALGMACSLLIMLWVNDEKAVDGSHAHSAQLYDVYYRQFLANRSTRADC
jgi:putative ABC transport system permease protein